MSGSPLVVEFEGPDLTGNLVSGEFALADLTALLRSLDCHDLTVIVRHPGADGQLMLAISGRDAFVGLDRGDGIYQFVPFEAETVGVKSLTIGGQETQIASRYVVSIDTAADVVQAWAGPGDESALGAWERQ